MRLSIQHQLFSAFLSFALISQAFSQADYVATGGNWGTGGSWTGGVPASGTEGNENIIHIPEGVSITIPSGQDISLDDVVLLIEGDLTVSNSGFNYSTLTINGTNAGVAVAPGGTITDPSVLGLGNFVRVNGVDLWGGQLYNNIGGSALYTNDFTATNSVGQPASITSNPAYAELLPVDLVAFEVFVKDGSVTVEWTTASEKDNYGFEIQRSKDGEHFDVIGFVEGFGTTTDIHSYSFRDINSGSAYYRLKQIDYDGQSELSPIKYLLSDPSQFGFKLEIYPNPTLGEVNIRGPLTDFALFDEAGRLLLHAENTTSYQAQQQISKLLKIQKAGNFYLTTTLNGKKMVNRIVKQ